MNVKRGALLVLEGCDKAGKSTQVKKLVQVLRARDIPAESRAFPDRRTKIGEVINQFLSCKEDFAPEAVQLLFSANRWECKAEIESILRSGTTLIVDRYAASGAAYAAVNTGRDLSWCKEPDRGLPRPDAVVLLEVSEATQLSRSAWGDERFEKADFQRKVAGNLHELSDETWRFVDADQSEEVVHSKLLGIALEVINRAKECPLGTLYVS